MRSILLTAILISTVVHLSSADEMNNDSSQDRPLPLAAPFDAETAKAAQETWAKFLGKSSPTEKNSVGMEMVLIPPGQFAIGSPAKDRSGNKEQVEVTLTKAFYVGKTEVTQGQYESLMGENPSWFSKTGGGNVAVKGLNTSDYPVENVSWDNAQTFCKKLTQKEGVAYRLLTEAEWEYACRAGTTTKFSTGEVLSSSDANFGDTKLNRTTSVGHYTANAFGLHDMHGNVYEWCEDVYVDKLPGGTDPLVTTGGSNRVRRGGGWSLNAANCRSAVRLWNLPSVRNFYLGFRVARSSGE